MTREEFYAKWGECLVTFKNYYKYSFTYAGDWNGHHVVVSYGGSSDDIYRYEVAAGAMFEVRSEPDFRSGTAYLNGAIVDEFYEAY